MQIIDRGGKTTIKLLLAEARILRNASYLLDRVSRNVEDDDAQDYEAAAETCRELVNEGTTEEQRKKLDEQDSQEPDVPVDETKSPESL